MNATATMRAVEEAIAAGRPVHANATCIVGRCGSSPVLGECLPCDVVRDNSTLNAWMARHPNSTQNALWFIGAYAQLPLNVTSLSDLSYALIFNYSSSQFPVFGSTGALQVQRELQQALLERAVEKRHNTSAASAEGAGGASSGGLRVRFNYSVSSKSFPKPPPRISDYDVFASNGGQWLFIVPALSFFHVLTELVHEKEAKLRVAMRMMGLRTSAFWAAWVTYGGVTAVITTAVLEVSGYAASFDFFVNSNFAATFLLFLSFTCAMLALAMLLSTVIGSSRTASAAGYGFVLVGFVIQCITTSAYAGILDLFYGVDVSDWVRHVRYLLDFYPPFHFSK